MFPPFLHLHAHENQFLSGCVKHVRENTELAIRQSNTRKQIEKLTPLTIGKCNSMGIQYGFEFSLLIISQTIPLHLGDKIFVLYCGSCLNDVK